MCVYTCLNQQIYFVTTRLFLTAFLFQIFEFVNAPTHQLILPEVEESKSEFRFFALPLRQTGNSGHSSFFSSSLIQDVFVEGSPNL